MLHAMEGRPGSNGALTRPGARTGDQEMIDPTRRAVELLVGKWRIDLVFLLASGVRRHGQLHQRLDGVSKKVLTQTLRGLERDGLVTRRPGPTPSRVDYALSPMGWTLTEPLMALYEWAARQGDDLERARASYDARDGAGVRLARPDDDRTLAAGAMPAQSSPTTASAQSGGNASPERWRER